MTAAHVASLALAELAVRALLLLVAEVFTESSVRIPNPNWCIRRASGVFIDARQLAGASSLAETAPFALAHFTMIRRVIRRAKVIAALVITVIINARVALRPGFAERAALTLAPAAVVLGKRIGAPWLALLLLCVVLECRRTLAESTSLALAKWAVLMCKQGSAERLTVFRRSVAFDLRGAACCLRIDQLLARCTCHHSDSADTLAERAAFAFAVRAVIFTIHGCAPPKASGGVAVVLML